MKRLLLVLLLSVPAFAGDREITPENVTALMNVYRAEAGLGPLRLDARLTRAATARMQEMMDGQWWGHASPDGTPPFVWITAADYNYVAAAENLAAGFETTGLLVQSWIESPGHRANILNGLYADCGIAVIDGSTQGPAVGKSIVVLFGKKQNDLLIAKIRQ